MPHRTRLVKDLTEHEVDELERDFDLNIRGLGGYAVVVLTKMEWEALLRDKLRIEHEANTVKAGMCPECGSSESVEEIRARELRDFVSRQKAEALVALRNESCEHLVYLTHFPNFPGWDDAARELLAERGHK